jgi:Flp pilus assembly protein TadG
MPIASAREDVAQRQLPDDTARADAPRRRRPARIGTRHLPKDDRGSSVVEFTILFPIIVILLLGGPQLALWYFARESAQSAASSAGRAACVQNATDGAGKQAADTFLSKVGNDTISSYTYGEQDAATQVSVHIHVTVPRVIPLPGFNPAADVHVTCSKERFTTPDSP